MAETSFGLYLWNSEGTRVELLSTWMTEKEAAEERELAIEVMKFDPTHFTIEDMGYVTYSARLRQIEKQQRLDSPLTVDEVKVRFPGAIEAWTEVGLTGRSRFSVQGGYLYGELLGGSRWTWSSEDDDKQWYEA